MGATAAVHPADPILQAYGLGKLDDVSSISVSKHLEGCDSCQRRVAELSSDEFLGRLRNAQVKADKATSGWSPSASSSTEGASRPVVPPPPADTVPPELVDHPDYEIVRELGRGGMGVVYLVKTGSWGGWKCSRSSADISSNGLEWSTASSGRSGWSTATSSRPI